MIRSIGLPEGHFQSFSVRAERAQVSEDDELSTGPWSSLTITRLSHLQQQFA